MLDCANEPEDLAGQVSIIYMSCAKFSDLWTTYFALFRRNWPECPFPIYVLTDTDGPDIERVRTLRCGTNGSWSDNLLFALSQVRTPYVLLLLDDFFVLEPVPHGWVVERIQWAVRSGHNYLRLCKYEPRPVGDSYDQVGCLPPRTHYRNSTRFPLWRCETLKKVLVPGESAWEFEVKGSVRSDEFQGFHATYFDPFVYANCVIKGKWNPAAILRLRARDIELDSQRRQYMGVSECARYALARIRSKILNLLPRSSQRVVRGFLLGMTRRSGW